MTDRPTLFPGAAGPPEPWPIPEAGTPVPHARSAAWRIVFFGSAEFSLPALEALARGPDQVVLAVTPPPAPAGRGRRLTPSSAAELADRLDLPRLEARSVRSPEVIETIRAARPDLLVVAAYGGFLPPALLNLCPYPPLNLHPSLLPRHRGAAPVNWSLIHGDEEVGVSVIFLEEEMDAGPILRQRAFAVDGPDGAGAWEKRLALAGAGELLAAIADLKEGNCRPIPQNHAQATVNRLLRKADGRVDFARPASRLAGLINGLDPWPGAQTVFQGKQVKMFGASAAGQLTETSKGLADPGRILGLDDQGRLLVAAGGGVLALAEVQPEGKKRLAAADFLRGYRPEKLG